MNVISPSSLAERYGANAVRTHRDIEYDAFSRTTRELQRAERGEGSVALAASLNAQLWTMLAVDLADDENSLPEKLRADLLSLAIFSIRSAQRAMNGGCGLAAMIEVNLAIMKGLRGEVPKCAA